MLVKAGYQLYFYKNERGTLEIDFMVRDAHSLVPMEVKANGSATASLNALIEKEQHSNDIISRFSRSALLVVIRSYCAPKDRISTAI